MSDFTDSEIEDKPLASTLLYDALDLLAAVVLALLFGVVAWFMWPMLRVLGAL